jgi:drug/metabolite transporter (DMT)-like permease
LAIVSKTFEHGQRVRWLLVACLLVVAIAAGVVLFLTPDSGVGPLPSANERLDQKAAAICDWALLAAFFLTAFTLRRSVQHHGGKRSRRSR